MSFKDYLLAHRNRIGLGILAFLVVANIIRYVFFDWGLITVHAQDKPLGEVIKSIASQGWVKIYTDMDPTTPVSMDVDHVPLAEAMETLAANVDRPPRTPDNNANGGGASPAGGGGGGGGSRRSGGMMGSFGDSARWALAFFAAPTDAQVKQEISEFQSGNPGDDVQTFGYTTSLDMLAGTDPDYEMPASDPRRQIWPGLKSPPPAPPQPATAQDGQTNQPPAPPAPPSTISDFLGAFARQSNIWIMAPSSWDNPATAPGPSSSIISAVKSLVASAHGAVEDAIILRGGHYTHSGDRHRGFGNEDTGWMDDRMRSAIDGLPADARPAALANLDEEIKFQNDVRAAPAEQRMAMMMDHYKNRAGRNFWRQSPQKRAQRYQQAVANRQAARGGA